MTINELIETLQRYQEQGLGDVEVVYVDDGEEREVFTVNIYEDGVARLWGPLR